MNKRMPYALFALASAALLVTGCTPAPKETKIADPGTQVSGTVELWHFFTEREAQAIDQVVGDFTASHPNIKVTVKSGQDDSKVTQAIGAGNGPDIGLSYSTDIVGKFCSSGAWVDLTAYINRDKIDLNQLNATTRSYTEFQGKRCAMPFLADAYGMFYNKDLFAKAGIAGPPKTLDELTEDAKKLTVRNADGSLKTVGFLPLYDYYENAAAHLAPSTGAKWLTPDGKSAVGADPNWKTLLNWQKSLVDWYGYDNLTRFKAGLGDEFSADNAFQKGQVAINIDAEYRLAFLKDQSPKLKYGVAPLPTTDPARYGGGYVTGNIMGISKNAKNPEAAWELIKYLTTDDAAVTKLAGLLKNVPTTTKAIADPGLNADPDFKTFIDIFRNPNSMTTPPSASGPAYQETFGQFLTSYQSGKGGDLDQGLAAADQKINSVMSLGG
ncbi:Maltotriose-binding protein [Actinoplanes sp. SE50]|uniref:ABC transporter substrate-binding protein n=1 Tax=unclassified Actinoplanes TaxID=2626549 RepID=UPI00023EC41F|nr:MULTISPECIES: ABC transporter substrate-binding protein [unclassified Actinoplanes]AEV83049.1 Maltotriose-binding protein [Actinoplanes sp. SE50/110]ATO81445.1 Maltotriose-binding protein [Actinoplanes sp. SE50]SLL98852.1 sugar ABC transporter substrate-binding protein [Actinoplanes sp. SE50/110]